MTRTYGRTVRRWGPATRPAASTRVAGYRHSLARTHPSRSSRPRPSGSSSPRRPSCWHTPALPQGATPRAPLSPIQTYAKDATYVCTRSTSGCPPTRPQPSSCAADCRHSQARTRLAQTPCPPWQPQTTQAPPSPQDKQALSSQALFTEHRLFGSRYLGLHTYVCSRGSGTPPSRWACSRAWARHRSQAGSSPTQTSRAHPPATSRPRPPPAQGTAMLSCTLVSPIHTHTRVTGATYASMDCGAAPAPTRRPDHTGAAGGHTSQTHTRPLQSCPQQPRQTMRPVQGRSRHSARDT
jgi:hypothetical protein